MGRCWACGGELDPAWKFCIHCGIPVERDEQVPSAIRPDGASAPSSSSTLAIFGWIMVGIGVLLIGAGVAALLYFA